MHSIGHNTVSIGMSVDTQGLTMEYIHVFVDVFLFVFVDVFVKNFLVRMN